MTYRSIVLSLSFLFCITVLRGQAPLHIFYTSDINGVLKADFPDLRGDILRIKAAMNDIRRREALRPGQTLLFDTGDALAFHYQSQLDSGRTVFNNMIEAGYDAMVAGNLDFLYGIDNLKTLNALDKRFAVLGTNLVWKNDTSTFSTYRIYEREGLRIGVIGLVEEQLAEKVIANRSGHLFEVGSAVETLKTNIQKLRDTTDVLIAINHLDMYQNLELCRRVAGIDLVISKSNQDSLQALRVFDERSRRHTTIVAAPAFARGIGHLEIRWEGAQTGAQITDIVPRESIPVLEVPFDTIDLSDFRRQEELLSKAVSRRYRNLHPDDKLAAIPESPSGELMKYALYTMLRSTQSEIAILNHGMLVQPVLNRLTDSLSVRNVEGITRPFEPVYIMRLTGKKLKAILERGATFDPEEGPYLHTIAAGDYALHSPADLKPHGLPIEDEETYAVVTNRFLAEGGDGYADFLDGTHRRWRFEGDLRLSSSESETARPVTLEQLLIRYLNAGMMPAFAEDPLRYYQRESFVNRPLWLVKFENIDFSFKSVQVQNNENFENANDKRVSSATQNARNIATAGYVAGVRRTRKTRWENGALFRYALQRIGDQEEQESDDKLELQTIFDWNDPFNIYKDHKRMNLYSSVRFDTEFTRARNEEGEIVPRRQDLYLYLGVSRFGKADREIRLAFFAKRDLANNDTDAGIELNAKYFKDFGFFKHGSIIRGRYLFNEPGRMIGDEKASLDYTAYFEFKIFGFINLKPQFNWFVYQDMVLRETASNLQFSLNLSFSRLWKPQYIKFLRPDNI